MSGILSKCDAVPKHVPGDQADGSIADVLKQDRSAGRRSYCTDLQQAGLGCSAERTRSAELISSAQRTTSIFMFRPRYPERGILGHLSRERKVTQQQANIRDLACCMQTRLITHLITCKAGLHKDHEHQTERYPNDIGRLRLNGGIPGRRS